MVLDTHEASSNGGHENQPPIRLTVLECSLANEELGARIEVENVVKLLLRYFLRLVPGLGA